jgi:regulator of replication initiation timing
VAQYQAYVEQMQVQSRQLQAQVNTLLTDKEHLLSQRRELENTVAELQQRTAADVTEARDAIAVKQTLTDTVTKLQQEIERVTQLYNAQVCFALYNFFFYFKCYDMREYFDLCFENRQTSK